MYVISLYLPMPVRRRTCRETGQLASALLLEFSAPDHLLKRRGGNPLQYQAPAGSRVDGQAAMLRSFPPLPVFLPPDPMHSTGAFPGEFRNASHWLSPPLLSKHDYHVLKAILLGGHPSLSTLLITAPNGLLSHVGQFQAYRICSSAGSLSGQLLSVHTHEAGLNLVLQGK